MNQYTNPYQNFSPNQFSQSNPYSPYYGQQVAQPSQQAPVAPIQPTTSIIQVTGVDGAKAYQMAPNSSVALFDLTGDRFFIKSSDAANFPTMKSFVFKEEVQEAPNKTESAEDLSATYLTRKEFEERDKTIEELRTTVEDLKKMLDDLTK